MSQGNVELVRSLYRAGEPSRFFDLLAEEVELDFSAYPVPGSPSCGARMPRSTGRAVGGAPGTSTSEATEIIDADEDRVVVVQYERGRGKGSGVQLERRWAVVYTLPMGKVVRFRAFRPGRSLVAAGVRG